MSKHSAYVMLGGQSSPSSLFSIFIAILQYQIACHLNGSRMENASETGSVQLQIYVCSPIVFVLFSALSFLINSGTILPSVLQSFLKNEMPIHNPIVSFLELKCHTATNPINPRSAMTTSC